MAVDRWKAEGRKAGGWYVNQGRDMGTNEVVE